jgi:hypothetical protein
LFGIVGLLVFCGLIAAIAWGLALLLDAKARLLGTLVRSLIAGITAGLVGMSPAFFAVLRLPGEIDFAGAIVPLFTGIAALGLLVGFPTAMLVSRRRARKRAAQFDPTVFD